MVLVDSAHEDQFLRFPEPIRSAQGLIWEQQRAMVTGLRTMIEAGPVDLAMIPVPPQLPPATADRLRALIATTKAVDTMLAELDTIEGIHAEAREAGITSLGDIPLVVITHGVPPPPFPPRAGDQRRGDATLRRDVARTPRGPGRSLLARASGGRQGCRAHDPP
jgi:hypothetical protein